jgi:hypothetical protein
MLQEKVLATPNSGPGDPFWLFAGYKIINQRGTEIRREGAEPAEVVRLTLN